MKESAFQKKLRILNLSRKQMPERRNVMNDIIIFLLLIFLIICAIAVSFSKNLLNSVIIFMSYSTVMAIIWILLESPDLAITEAAVGAGITSVLFFVTLKKIHKLHIQKKQSEENDSCLKNDEKEDVRHE